MSDVTVSVKANQCQAMLTADGMTGLGGKLTTLSLRTKDGKMALLVPPEMFPFIEKGDVVFVSLTVVKSSIEAQAPAPPLIIGKQH